MVRNVDDYGLGFIGERKRYGPLHGVVGVGSVSRVGVGSYAFLFERVVCKGLAAGVLTEPYRLGGTVGEADHVVFPGNLSLEAR